jgi:hypothetical protein
MMIIILEFIFLVIVIFQQYILQLQCNFKDDNRKSIKLISNWNLINAF